MEVGRTRAAAGKRRSNRQQVEWVPVTRLAYGRAIVAADAVGVDLAIWVDEAIMAHLARTRHELREARYRAACEVAAEQRRATPQRWEVFGATKGQGMPFVRPAPEASGEHQAGRPSSRHPQKATGAQARSAGPQAGAEPRAAAGAQRRGEHGEHPPVDGAEHRGTARPVIRP